MMEDVDTSSAVEFTGNEASWQDYQEGMGRPISGSGSETRQFEEEGDESGFSEYYHADAAGPPVYNNGTFIRQDEGASHVYSENRRLTTPDTSPNSQSFVREVKTAATQVSQRVFRSQRK